MIEELLNSYDQTLGLIERTVSGLSADEAVAQPVGVPNHPAWTLGHLVHSAEAIGGELGLEAWLPEGWGERFGTGSQPATGSDSYPPIRELLRMLNDARQRLGDSLRAVGPDTLAGPLPDVRYRSIFPSLGHATLHILSAHAAFHAGQLMVWRRAMQLSTEASQ